MDPFRDINNWFDVYQIKEFLKTNDVDVKNEYGNTALHLASLYRATKNVRILISHGADVNAKNNNGRTPLNIASSEGHVEIVLILLANGADVNVKDCFGCTPLYLAVIYDYKELAAILLDLLEINLKELLDINLRGYKETEIVKEILNTTGMKDINGVEEILNNRKINMINKLKIIQIGRVGIEILEFIGGYLYPDISVKERLSIINEI